MECSNSNSIFRWINSFNIFGQIWMYQAIFTIGLIDIICGTCILIGMISSQTEKMIRKYKTRLGYHEKCEQCKLYLSLILKYIGLIIVYFIGLFIAPILMEILNYIPFAFVLYHTIDDKIPCKSIIYAF